MSGLAGLLWVFSIVLAIVLLVLGLVLLQDNAGAKKRLGWPENMPRGLSRFFGVVMIIGALGLVVPLFVPAVAWIAPAAAGMIAALMLGIAQSYLARRDTEGAAIYIMLIVLFVALAVLRWPAVAARLG